MPSDLVIEDVFYYTYFFKCQIEELTDFWVDCKYFLFLVNKFLRKIAIAKTVDIHGDSG